MLIGINAAAALKQPRTGVEEYTYQLIRHLAMLKESKEHRFLLYVPSSATFFRNQSRPLNFIFKELLWRGPMWTQLRLALEMSINQPEVLFIPVHVLPFVHPKNSVVTLHGVEYEYYPQMYPRQHLRYLRWSTRYALKKARKIIAVSENTRKDLLKWYHAQPEKIAVVHHGFSFEKASLPSPENNSFEKRPYILFVGRLEAKKNILGLLKAFDLLKKKYKVPHKLILGGPRGYGYEKIITPWRSRRNDIIEKGYLTEKEKWLLLQKADVFVLPSFYEGFGLPILEAQAAGCPVVTSNVSSLPEIAGQGALLVDPKDIEQIAEAMYKIINEEQCRKNLIKEGYQNLKRFSWQRCAQETLKILTE